MLAKKYRFYGLGSVRPALKYGRRVRGRGIRAAYLPNKRRQQPRFAVLVSKKVSKQAVVRNRIRRRIFEAIRDLEPRFQAANDLVITIYDERYCDMAWPKLKAEVERLLLESGTIS